MANTNVQAAAAEREVTSSVQFLTVTAIFVALTYIFTAFINVRLPIAANGGLIHLGNVPLFIGAIIFGKKTGAIAGGVGMGLFDLLSGWTLWAPFTFVIVGLMGFTVGKLTEDEKHQNFKWYVIALISACVIKVRLLYRGSRNLRKSTCTGCFHSWQPGTDRCCSSHHSCCYRTTECCSKKNWIKKIRII